MVTPVIGNEFPKGSCNIMNDILQHPDAEQRIRDLAVMGKSLYISVICHKLIQNSRRKGCCLF